MEQEILDSEHMKTILNQVQIQITNSCRAGAGSSVCERLARGSNTKPKWSLLCSLVVLLLWCTIQNTPLRAQGIGADSVRLGNQNGGSIWLSLPSNTSSAYRMIFPSSIGLASSQLLFVDGTSGQMNVLSPGNNADLLHISSGSLSWINRDTMISLSAWSLRGNAATNPSTMFLGTTDAQPLRILTNNTERIRILSTGNIGIGTSSPSQRLHLSGGNLYIDSVASGIAAELRLANPLGTFYSALKSGAQTSNIVYTLPLNAPLNGQVLSSDASSNLSWVSLATVANGTVTNSTLHWNGTSWVENTDVKTSAGALTLGANSSAGSIVVNDGQVASKTATIGLANQAANRIYTIPEAGANANFVMTEGAQTVNGAKTFGSAPTVTPFSTAGVVKNNASGLLSSGTVDLTSANDVSGILPVANGGTGVATMTGFPSGNGTAAMTARTMTGTANQVSVTNGDGIAGNPTFALSTDPIVPGNASITIPAGTTAQQPGTPANGMMRYNSTTSKFEFYQNGAWTNYSTGGAGVASGTVTNSTLRWDGTSWVENTDVKTSAGALTLGANSSAGSIVVNDGQVASKTATIGLANQAANRIYTIPEAGANANFVMTEGAQTVNGAKTFGSAPTVTPFSTAGVVKNNASGLLSSGAVDLASANDVSGILPVANGGTGVATVTGFPAGNGTAAMTARTMTGTANQVSVTNGDGIAGNPTFALSTDPIVPGTASITIPAGTTAQQPVTPTNGMMRYNSTTSKFEFYQNGAWTNYATGGAGVGSGTVTSSTLRWNGTSWVENTDVKTSAGALTLGANSSAGSIVVNDGQVASKTATIGLANQAANRVYTIPEAGANANFVMTEGAQTVNGAKTFGSAPTVTPFSTAGVVKNNASGLLSSGTVDLASANDVSGILPVANGGTGVATMTGFPSGNGTAAMTARTMTGTANQVSVTNGDGIAGNPTFALATDPIVPGTASITVPAGTTAQQPVTPANGMMRYNSTTSKFEFYQNGAWTNYATGGAGVGSGTVTSSTLRWNGTSWVENTDVKTSAGALTLGANSSAGSIVVNDGQVASKTATIGLATQAANRIYTIPEAGANANFVMTEGAQSINGAKTFGSAPTVTPFSTAGVVKNNASGLLSSGAVDLTSANDVSGILPVANGGTGVATVTGFPSGNGTAAMTARTMTGTANQVSVTNGDGIAGNPTFALATNPIVPGTASITIPVGTTAQQPGTPANGMMRYNSTTGKFEFYENGSWTNYSSSTAGWLLSGNATSSAWTGSAGSYLGTTSANPLVLATTNATAQDIRFFTGANGANERLRINSTGEVGIGTSGAPGYGLEVNHSTIYLHNGATPYFYAAGGTNVGIGISSTPNSPLTIGGGTSIGYNLAAPTNGLIVQGSVGIGTSSPTSILHLDGITQQAMITAQGAGSGSLAAGVVLRNTSLSNWRGVGISMLDSGGQNEWYAGRPYGNGFTYNSDNFSVLRRSGAATHNDAVGAVLDGGNAATGTVQMFTIDKNGNTGIGVWNPTQRLHVGGNLLVDTSSSGTAGKLILNNPARSYSSSFKAGAQSVNIDYTLPTAAPSAGNVLSSNASGVMSWVDPASVANAWSLSGNTTSGSNYILGTLDSAELSIRVYNTKAGQIGIGNYNTTFGYQAGLVLASGGNYNTFLGSGAGKSNTTLGVNTYVGHEAGRDINAGGGYNTIMGAGAGKTSTSAGYSVFVGANTGGAATGQNATYIGAYAGRFTTADNNTLLGYNAGYYNTTGANNTLVGTSAGQGPSSNAFSNSTMLGYQSGFGITSGSNNLLLGYKAGDALTTGSNNIVLGYDIDAQSNTSSNQLNIGNIIYGTSINGSGSTISSGSIGIGVPAPAQRLHVAGNVLIDTSASSTAGKLIFNNPARSFATSIKAGAQAANIDYTWPISLTPTSTTTTGVLMSDGSGTLTWVTPTALALASAWTLSGNSGTVDGTNFIGTTDNIPFNIRVNNQKAGRIDNTNALVSLGYQAGNVNTGTRNTFIGYTAGALNNAGLNNSFFGAEAGYSNVSGNHNTFFGDRSGYYNTASHNAFYGQSAGYQNTSGAENTFIGRNAGENNNLASQNTFLGRWSGYQNTSAGENVALGYAAMYTQSYSNSSTAWSSYNVALGAQSLYSNQPTTSSNGTSNTAIGYKTLYANTTGANNIALGFKAGDAITTGSNNIIIGHDIDAPSATGSNQLSIGNLIFGTTVNGSGTTISSGRIGIGTADPSQRLHVAGNVLIDTSASSTAGKIIFNNPARTFATSFAAGAQAANIDYTLPTSAPTLGQVLTSNASGVLSWSTPSTAATSLPISGLTAATATNTINNADYAQSWQWNSLAASSALTLSSSSTGAQSNSQTLLNIALSGANSTSTQTTYGLQVANTHSGTSSTNVGGYFSASGGTNNYGLIVASGNAGFGTITPGSTVDVKGTLRLSGSNSGYVGFAPASSAGSTTYTLPTADGSNGYVLSTNGSGTLSWASPSSTVWSLTGNSGTTSGTNFLGTLDNQDLMFKTNSTERLTIGKSTGFIHLNQSNQNTVLGYQTGLSMTGGANVAVGYQAMYFNVAGTRNAALGFAALSTNVSGQDNVAVGIVALSSTTGNYNVGIGSSAGYSLTSGSRNIVIGHNAAVLHTTGSNNIFIGDSACYGSATSGSNYLSIGNAIYGNNIYTSTPFIGIGNSSPGSALDVKGTLRLTGSTSGYVGFAPAAAAGSTTYTLPSADGSSGQVLSTNGSATLSWATAATASTAWMRAGNSSTAPGTDYLGTTDAQAFVIKTNATERARFTNGTALQLGVQGSGATSPSSSFTVGPAGWTAASTSTNQTGSNLILQGGPGTGTGTPGYISFQTPATTGSGTTVQSLNEMMRITSDKIMIGGVSGSAPNYRLHIDANSGGQSYIQMTTGSGSGMTSTDGLLVGLMNDNTNALVWNQENGYMKFGTNGSERLRIDSAGNVGIGTSTPKVALDVNGAVVMRPGTSSITADNQAVTVGNSSFLRLTANAAPTSRTITLSNGLQDGQILYLRISGNGTATNGVELADSGNCNLSGLAQILDGGVIQLIWDGSASVWYEVSRSNN